MTITPPQGLRHAATLLLTHRMCAIPSDASRESITAALCQLAEDLAALADDMRAPPDAAAWLLAEFARTIDRLSATIDIATARDRAAVVIARIGPSARYVERRDLFLIYVADDRLPIAAPLAIELTRRRVSVAFSEYEVATHNQLASAVTRGLAHHTAGALLGTVGFNRMRLVTPLPSSDRVRAVQSPEAPSTVEDLAACVARLKVDGLRHSSSAGMAFIQV